MWIGQPTSNKLSVNSDRGNDTTMKQQEIINKIIEASEAIGWFVTTSKLEDDAVEVNFNTDTKYGQDLNCWATLIDTDIESLANEIQRWYECYDPDEETLLWVGVNGHGVNGAPYRLRDILNDMEDAESRLGDLAIALQTLAGEIIKQL